MKFDFLTGLCLGILIVVFLSILMPTKPKIETRYSKEIVWSIKNDTENDNIYWMHCSIFNTSSTPKLTTVSFKMYPNQVYGLSNNPEPFAVMIGEK